MDFQFTHHLGNVVARCSMEHQAVANWFNSEERSKSGKILTALSLLKQPLNQPEIILEGCEYSLLISADEVMVRANNLAFGNDDEILEHDFHYYDEESIAFCGTDDFAHFLQSYIDFIS